MTCTIASVSPPEALVSACNPVMMMIAALIDTPIEPITPMMAMMPNGYWKTAKARIDRPADKTQTISATALNRNELKVMTMVAIIKVTMMPIEANKLPSVLERASLSPPSSNR